MVTVRRLTYGSLFKLLALGGLGPAVLFAGVTGAAAAVGGHAVRINDHWAVGAEGLIGAFVVSGLLWVMYVVFIGGLSFLGLWMLSWFMTLDLYFVPPAAEVDDKPYGFDQ